MHKTIVKKVKKENGQNLVQAIQAITLDPYLHYFTLYSREFFS